MLRLYTSKVDVVTYLVNNKDNTYLKAREKGIYTVAFGILYINSNKKALYHLSWNESATGYEGVCLCANKRI